MISTRVRLILLILLNISIIILPAVSAISFLILILVFNILFYKSLLENIKLILLYLLGLFILSLLISVFILDTKIILVLPQFLKLFSVINITILLITNINVFELIATLSRLNIPTNLSLAFGVGFRYFPLLINDIKRIQFIQGIKGYGLNYNSIRRNGLIKSIDIFLTPLFLSILKRTDNIALSVTIQQIEKRSKNYQFNHTNGYEKISITLSFLFLFYSILIKLKI